MIRSVASVASVSRKKCVSWESNRDLTGLMSNTQVPYQLDQRVFFRTANLDYLTGASQKSEPHPIDPD